MTWEAMFAYNIRTGLTQNQRVTLSAVLDDAAWDIEDYGWKNGPTSYLESGFLPRCIWQAAMHRLENNSELRALPYSEQAITYALCQVTQADDLNDLFDLNDAQPLEEGQRWAAETLRNAAQFLRTVFATSQEEEADTDETQSPVSGFTRLVVNPAKRLLRKLQLVR